VSEARLGMFRHSKRLLDLQKVFLRSFEFFVIFRHEKFSESKLDFFEINHTFSKNFLLRDQKFFPVFFKNSSDGFYELFMGQGATGNRLYTLALEVRM